jgi:hypothetical protein
MSGLTPPKSGQVTSASVSHSVSRITNDARYSGGLAGHKTAQNGGFQNLSSRDGRYFSVS